MIKIDNIIKRDDCKYTLSGFSRENNVKGMQNGVQREVGVLRLCRIWLLGRTSNNKYSNNLSVVVASENVRVVHFSHLNLWQKP